MATATLGAHAFVGGLISPSAQLPVPLPMLIPGSPDLAGAHFSAKCTRVQRFARDVGDARDRSLGVQRVTEQLTSYRGRPALWIVTAGKTGDAFVDSMLVYRGGLAPILETYRTGRLFVRYDFDGAHVRMTSTNGDSAPVVKEHQYHFSVFSFQQLDAVIRSLPLRNGYTALLPLYSEGDDSVEVDTVTVEHRGGHGVWRVRFADPAIVATAGVDEKSRAQVAYAHTFRQSGASWKQGTIWRQRYDRCAVGG